jgi:hypothetical protein
MMTRVSFSTPYNSGHRCVGELIVTLVEAIVAALVLLAMASLVVGYGNAMIRRRMPKRDDPHA